MKVEEREKILRLLILRGWIDTDDAQAVRETMIEALEPLSMPKNGCGD